MTGTPEPWFTVAEIATAWGVSKNTVYDLIAANELGSVDIGQGRARTRIPQAAIDDFMRRRGRNLPTPRRNQPQAA